MLFTPEHIVKARQELMQQVQAGTISREQAFQRALEMDPSDAMALTYLSHLRFEAGDLGGAEEYCWRAIGADPTRFEPYYTLYRCLSGRGADRALENGMLALALRKMLRGEEGNELIESLAGKAPERGGATAREKLENTVEALEEQTEDESEEAARQLKPYRLIDELLEMAPDGLDPELVDDIVEDGARCTPLLIGVLRAMVTGGLPEGDSSPAAAAVALLGEIGDPALLPEVVECCSVADDAVREAADWAAARVAARRPQETLEVLRRMADGAGAELRYEIAMVLGGMPESGGGSDLLVGLLDGLGDLPKGERLEVFLSVAGAILRTQGPRGRERARSLLQRHAPVLPKRARAELRRLEDITEIMQETGAGAPKMTVYDFCGAAEEDEEREEDLEDFAPEPVRRQARPGRNDPCWCGSGKKYKKCHLEADEKGEPEPDNFRAPRPPGRSAAEQKLRARLLTFGQETLRKREIEEALAAFAGPAPTDDVAEDMARVEFLDWITHDYVAPRLGGTLIEEFLRRAPGGLAAGDRHMLEEWQRSRYSLFEVQEVRQGSGVQVRDLLAGGEFFVHDVSSSNHMARWDCCLARSEATGGRVMFSGIARMVPPHAVGPLQEWAGAARRRSGLSWDPFLRANSHKLRQKASELVRKATDALQVVSFEGDPLVFSRSVYEVVDDGALRTALDGSDPLEKEDDPGAYVWLSEENAESGGRRVFGHLRIAGGRLTLECSTRQRLERGKELLRGLAGAALRHKGDEFQSWESAMKSARKSSIKPAASSLPPEAEHELVQKVLAEHYRKWPDMPLPALDGKTPREAAATSEGRSQLVELLKTFENGEERNRREGRAWYDIGLLKAELGIEF
jgi:tetratricopeptide (TPR) repeat protein